MCLHGVGAVQVQTAFLAAVGAAATFPVARCWLAQRSRTDARSSALTAFAHTVALAHLSSAANDPAFPASAQTTALVASMLNAIVHTPNATESHPGVVSGVGTRFGASGSAEVACMPRNWLVCEAWAGSAPARP